MSVTIEKQRVPYIDLGLQHQDHKAEFMAEIEKVIDSGWFILGENVTKFEKDFAELCGAKYAVGLNSGTDALFLAMLALGIGPGDEVITAPNSYLASASSVALIGATPVFADVGEDYNIDPDQIRAAITERTKAIIPVHLTGRPADMDAIMAIAKEHGLAVIEDCAQAVCAKYNGEGVGSIGDAGCFSLHPLKNLNAVGDGGVLTTNSDEMYQRILKARNHGLKNRNECEFWSFNSRLDAIQAAVLNVKMRYIEGVSARRRSIARLYRELLADVVTVPQEKPHEYAVYHTFIVLAERRDELQQYLKDHGVDTKIHYPIPIHLQEAARDLGYGPGSMPVTEHQVKHILSLPVFPELTDDQVRYVSQVIHNFYAS